MKNEVKKCIISRAAISEVKDTFLNFIQCVVKKNMIMNLWFGNFTHD